MLKLNRKQGGDKYTPEELADIDVEVIKKMIEEQVPNAFSKKAPVKKAAKKTAKKAATKK